MRIDAFTILALALVAASARGRANCLAGSALDRGRGILIKLIRSPSFPGLSVADAAARPFLFSRPENEVGQREELRLSIRQSRIDALARAADAICSRPCRPCTTAVAARPMVYSVLV